MGMDMIVMIPSLHHLISLLELWWKKSQMQMAKENQILMRYYAQTILANQILNLSEI